MYVRKNKSEIIKIRVNILRLFNWMKKCEQNFQQRFLNVRKKNRTQLARCDKT